MKRAIVIPIFVFAVCGCSVKRTAVRYTADIMQSAMPAVYEEGDIETAREAILPMLKTAEGILRTDPGNEGLHRILAQGYCGYAFMFLEDKDNVRATVFYRRGAEYARQLLSIKGYDKALVSGIKIDGMAPELFWYTFCRLGSVQINLNDTDEIAAISSLEKNADLLISAAPGFNYNGPYLIKAAINAARPKMLGGNPETAKNNFESAVSGVGADYLLNKYLYAKLYAVQTQDTELFRKMLLEIAAQKDPLPGQRLINTVVKRKAAELLEKENELF